MWLEGRVRGFGVSDLRRAPGPATIGALIDPAHAREDWRSAARKLTAPAVVVTPAATS